MSDYKKETQERFGNTEAYKQYEEKTANYTKNKWQEVNDGIMAVFNKFAACMNSENTADSDKAQAIVKELQEYITENYYTCTNDILAGLGQMYVSDERFRENLDKHTKGTAAFASKAIEFYCK